MHLATVKRIDYKSMADFVCIKQYFCISEIDAFTIAAIQCIYVICRDADDRNRISMKVPSVVEVDSIHWLRTQQFRKWP